MISIKQIKYALAVAKTKHFKQAASNCAISQSALSTAITELEQQLNIQIFERDNKKVLITPIGKQFLEQAQQIKVAVDDLYLLSQTAKTPFSYPISVGVIPTIGPYLLPKVLPAVRKQYPEFQLSIVEDTSKRLVTMVKNGDLDTAILALPYPLEGLHAFKFWQENFYVIVNQSDSLTRLKQISSKQLQQKQLLLLREDHCLKEHALAACKIKSLTNNLSMEGTSLYTLIQMVASNMGVTLVPAMALDQFITRKSEFKAIPLREKGPHRDIAFITRLSYAGVSNIELLIEIFRKQLLSVSCGLLT